MKRWLLAMMLGVPLAGAWAQPAGLPHAWLFGSWTGGIMPAGDTADQSCTGSPSVIFTKDVVMRSSMLDVAYRQRLIETVQATPNGVEFRLVPAGQQGARLPLDIGFGCDGDPNLLRVERRGPNEIAFPNCSDFPSVLKRCGSP
ncbi:hypothetical protein IAI18_08510 [Acetobacteraceae bacterium H6797]|nr:hypothetical protein [Acetobacteraceae bacterium H6797]